MAFRYKDYARGRRVRTLRLEAPEFIRRFLFHVLPKRFVRIRRYGLLANAHREENLARCRELLSDARDAAPTTEPTATTPAGDRPHDQSDQPEPPRCPACSEGRMRRVQILLASKLPRSPPLPARAAA